jgi:hypothetical protein
MIDHETRLHEYGSNGDVYIGTYLSVRVRMTTEERKKELMKYINERRDHMTCRSMINRVKEDCPDNRGHSPTRIVPLMLGFFLFLASGKQEKKYRTHTSHAM